MSNLVEKAEDKSVDNVDKPENAPWLDCWSNFLAQPPFVREEADSAQISKLLQALIHAAQAGDSGLLISSSDLPRLATFIISDVQAKTQLAPLVFDGEILALYRYWQLEQRLATAVFALSQTKPTEIQVNQYRDLLPDPHQRAALFKVATTGFSIITGGPGTGKTYTLARIVAVLNHQSQGLRIAMAAPTGKAAQRMQEALQASLNDPELQATGLVQPALLEIVPKTLHRLLGIGQRRVPKFNSKAPLPYDLIVVDEASMLDLALATLLFEAISKGSRLILLGDANQLASVDVGSVLADLKRTPALAHNQVHLITSRRFHANAKIGQFAAFIQNLQPQTDPEQSINQFEQQIVAPDLLKPIKVQSSYDQVQLEYLPDEIIHLNDYYARLIYGFEAYKTALQHYAYIYQQGATPEQYLTELLIAFDHYRILVAVRSGIFGLDAINKMVADWLKKGLNLIEFGGWYLGRPVMMGYNDYQLGLSNGDIGICLHHRTQADAFEVYFPSLNQWIAVKRLPQNMQSAFALTIHKSQGSEFEHVAVVFNQDSQRLLSQELIYTAITRAKKVVSLMVNRKVLTQSLTTKTVRQSGLIRKINQTFDLLSLSLD